MHFSRAKQNRQQEPEHAEMEYARGVEKRPPEDRRENVLRKPGQLRDGGRR